MERPEDTFGTDPQPLVSPARDPKKSLSFKAQSFRWFPSRVWVMVLIGNACLVLCSFQALKNCHDMVAETSEQHCALADFVIRGLPIFITLLCSPLDAASFCLLKSAKADRHVSFLMQFVVKTWWLESRHLLVGLGLLSICIPGPLCSCTDRDLFGTLLPAGRSNFGGSPRAQSLLLAYRSRRHRDFAKGR